MSHKPDVIFVGAFKSAANDGTIGGQAYACRSLLESPLSNRVNWHLVDSTQRSQPPPGFFVRLFYAARRFCTVLWRLLANRIDATYVFTMYDFGSFLEKGMVAIAGRILGKKSVISLRSEVRDSKKEQLVIPFRKLVVWFCTHIVVQSEVTANQLVAKLGCPREKIRVIPNWIDTASYRVADRKHDPAAPVRFLFLGWLEVYKGVQHLIEAAGQLRARGIDFRVVIGGGGSEFENLKGQAEQLGLTENIEFLGWVSGEQKTNALRTADVLVLPSYSEGMPNAILEGMASGLAVIATPVGGIPALIKSEKQGLLVEVGNPEDLASAMARLTEDRELISAMGNCNEQRAVEHHDVHSVWPIVADLLGVESTK